MRKKQICTMAMAAFLGVGTVFPSLAGPGAGTWRESDGPGVYTEYATSLAPDVSAWMCKAEYWIEKNYGSDRLLLTREEIARLNQRILETPETNMTDLNALPETFDGTAMAASMGDFASPKNLYLDGEPVEEAYYEAIRENIRNAQVTEEMPVRYGYTVNQTVMKAYPYGEFLSDSPTDPEWDNLASAGLYVNEPVAIYFATADGRFVLAKGQSCSGWVPAEDVAVCKDKEEWMAAKPGENILVVTGEKVYLEAGAILKEVSEKRLPMGTVLERVTDTGLSVTGRIDWNNYVVKLPWREADGSFSQKLALIPANRDVSTEYLPFTSAGIIDQAFKLLGNRYGWGGMLYSQDCSSFVKDIYRCFGLEIPRNTTWQAAMPVAVADMSKMTAEERTAHLRSLAPGSILQFPGHEVLYLGEADGKFYVINDVSSVAVSTGEADGVERVRVRSVIVSTLDTKRMSGKTWFEDLNKSIWVAGE